MNFSQGNHKLRLKNVYERENPHLPHRALPITPDILLQMHKKLDMSNSVDNEMPNWHHPFETNVMSNWMDLICIFLKVELNSDKYGILDMQYVLPLYRSAVLSWR
jgi:hypothetical protein